MKALPVKQIFFDFLKACINCIIQLLHCITDFDQVMFLNSFALLFVIPFFFLPVLFTMEIFTNGFVDDQLKSNSINEFARYMIRECRKGTLAGEDR